MRSRDLALGMLLVALAAPADRAHAALRPEIIASAGATAATRGAAGIGGPALSLSLMWPVDDHVRFGAMGFLDDLGDRTGRLRDASGADLGPISVLHQAARGLAGRAEAHLPRSGRHGAFAVGTWGVYRVGDDVRGVRVRRTNAGGLGLGVGVTRAMTPTHTAGLTVRYQQLWRSVVQSYLSASLEWRWQRSVKE